MSKRKSLMMYLKETEQRLKQEYGLHLQDVHLPTLADCWLDGWSIEEFVDWYAGKYELQAVSE